VKPCPLESGERGVFYPKGNGSTQNIELNRRVSSWKTFTDREKGGVGGKRRRRTRVVNKTKLLCQKKGGGPRVEGRQTNVECWGPGDWGVGLKNERGSSKSDLLYTKVSPHQQRQNLKGFVGGGRSAWGSGPWGKKIPHKSGFRILGETQKGNSSDAICQKPGGGGSTRVGTALRGSGPFGTKKEKNRIHWGIPVKKGIFCLVPSEGNLDLEPRGIFVILFFVGCTFDQLFFTSQTELPSHSVGCLGGGAKVKTVSQRAIQGRARYAKKLSL